MSNFLVINPCTDDFAPCGVSFFFSRLTDDEVRIPYVQGPNIQGVSKTVLSS